MYLSKGAESYHVVEGVEIHITHWVFEAQLAVHCHLVARFQVPNIGTVILTAGEHKAATRSDRAADVFSEIQSTNIPLHDGITVGIRCL